LCVAEVLYFLNGENYSYSETESVYISISTVLQCLIVRELLIVSVRKEVYVVCLMRQSVKLNLV